MVQTDTLCLQPFVFLTHPDIIVGQTSSEMRIRGNVSTLVVSKGFKNTHEHIGWIACVF